MTALVLIFLLIGLPVTEILIFIEIGEIIGGISVLLVTIGTALLGIILFRGQGFDTLARARRNIENHRPPFQEVIGGMGLLVAAICLLAPGFVSDAVGALLFIPPLRLVLVSLVLRPLINKASTQSKWSGFRSGAQSPRKRGSGPIIDGEFVDLCESGDNGKTPAKRNGGILGPKDREKQ